MDLILKRLGDLAKQVVLGKGVTVAEAVSESLDDLSKDFPLVGEERLAELAEAELTGFGALEPFMSDPMVEELWMNKPNELFVCKNGQTTRFEIDFSAEQQAVAVDRMLRAIGRRVDRTMPFVDAPLDNGSRLHVVIPDVTRRFMSFNIRRYVQNQATLESLFLAGTMSESHLRALQLALAQRETIVISGPTAAGKTTLLSALLRSLPDSERVVSVEDTFELSIPNLDWVAMQTRPASIEGLGAIDMRRLIREALRMRPGRLVVGEVRGAEAVELLVALNSGIPALCTVHANSAEEAFGKLQTLPLLSGIEMPVTFLRQVLSSSISLIVHCTLTPAGVRTVEQIIRVSQSSGEARFANVA